jgi:hypothetical protein
MPKKLGIIVSALFAVFAAVFIALPAFGLAKGYTPAVAFGLVSIVAASFCFTQPGFLQESDGSISNRRSIAFLCVLAAIGFAFLTVTKGYGWIGLVVSGMLLVVAAISVGLITISEIKMLATQAIEKKLG